MSISGRHVIVGMSGGVDSSVAAALLLRQGFVVEGLFMKNWEEDDGSEYCTAKEDLADAQSVCDKLGIHLHRANFSAEYWDQVFEHFLVEYRAGRTPNPDILCNREIKFSAFLEYALALDADYIATGHYARLDKTHGRTRLLKGLDEGKDQSYFLQAVTEPQLDRVLFPIGDLQKSEVRSLAREMGLATHDKKDSTGICFIGERRFRDFLSTYVLGKPGDIITTDGQLVGHHSGVVFYTLGQRQGLGIGGVRDRPEQPWYVIHKDMENNHLVVAQGVDNPAMFSRRLHCSNWSWISGTEPDLPRQGHAKVRYRQRDQVCTISRTALGVTMEFEQRQRSVTPGQWACFYEHDWCLGGGIIATTEPLDDI